MYFYHIWKAYTPPPPPSSASVSIIEGMSIPISGSFIDPTAKTPLAGALVFVQKSLDNKTWTNVAAAVTDISGWVNVSVTPPIGTSYYRLYLTGYAANYTGSNPKYYEDLIARDKLPSIAPSMIGTSIKVETKTLASTIAEAVTPLTSEISDLKSAIDSLRTSIYASIGIAVIAIIVAIVAFIKKGRLS